ncbi:MAG: hypothetical protein ACRC1G_03445 [Bradyrhizobium sp.]|nr:hypothetical protein [Bradyrhizobium sp.]
MCRLYSSPKEVTSEVSWQLPWQSLGKLLGSSFGKSPASSKLFEDCLCSARHSFAFAGSCAVPNPADFADIRVQQRRVPQPPALVAGVESFTLPKQDQLCCVRDQAQYQAFVRFAVESSTASAIALKRPLRSGTVSAG